MSRIITITSGKGGVGKTNISLNLALQLSKMGCQTCLFDADFGLANINILLGLQPEYDLQDVIFQGLKLKDILIRLNIRLDILPGSSGVEAMADLEKDQTKNLTAALSEMTGYDFLLFDTSAGISQNVISLCLASSEVLLVITPEPTSLVDGFSLLKIMMKNGFKGEARLVLNQCKNANEAKLVYQKFKSAVANHLGVEILALGVIYQDVKVAAAVQQQRPVLELYPNTPFSKCIKVIAERLVSANEDYPEEEDMEGFWRHCIKLIKSPLDLPGKKKKKDKEGAAEPPQKGGQGKTGHTAKPLKEETQSVKAADSTSLSKPVSKEDDTQGPVAPPKGDGGAPQGQPADPGSPGEALDIEKSLMLNMEKLNMGISSISEGLRLVGEAIQTTGAAMPRPETSISPGTNRLAPKALRLDLKSFLKSRGLKKKEP